MNHLMNRNPLAKATKLTQSVQHATLTKHPASPLQHLHGRMSREAAALTVSFFLCQPNLIGYKNTLLAA